MLLGRRHRKRGEEIEQKRGVEKRKRKKVG